MSVLRYLCGEGWRCAYCSIIVVSASGESDALNDLKNGWKQREEVIREADQSEKDTQQEISQETKSLYVDTTY